jgi:hypothetical protein
MDSAERAIQHFEKTGGKPLRSYIKTILGKVFINTWDSFTERPVGLLLEGDPRNNDETCIYDIWSEKEDMYFRKSNKRHFETGTLIPYTRSDAPREKTFEESDDSELMDLVQKPFLALRNKLAVTESEAVLFRLLGIAESLDKSDKVTGAIKARISEVQDAPYLRESSTEEE